MVHEFKYNNSCKIQIKLVDVFIFNGLLPKKNCLTHIYL